MYLLSSPQILAAVRRSLAAHVLPELDGFARVQVVAALDALDEVTDRLLNGDPVAGGTDGLAATLAEVAETLPAGEAPLAEALRRVLAEHAEPTPEPRDRYRAIVEGVWSAIGGSEQEGAARVRRVLAEHSGLLLAGDLGWMCEEAVASLR